MSESTVRSQVRFSEKINPDPVSDSLVPIEDIQNYFGITDGSMTNALMTAAAIVTSVIRGYTGRIISKGSYTETFTDVFDPKTERYLIETPIASLDTVPSGTLLLNKKTGRVLLIPGQVVPIIYTGGYDPLPNDLMGVFMELIRQQMAIMGYDQIGTAPTVSGLAERSVTVGTLRVDYATGANSAHVTASGGGAITKDALAPYTPILLQYTSRTSLVST